MVVLILVVIVIIFCFLIIFFQNTAKSKKNVYNTVTANDFVDVRDISRNLLITKSGYKIGFLRLFPINIDLLSNREKESLTDTITGEFKSEKNPFIIYSIPRTIDMDAYLSFLGDCYDREITNAKRKMLLNIMINEANEKALSGKNCEHQFYIKVWEKADIKDCDKRIEERLYDLSNRFNSINNANRRIDDIEIIKLCNLFANSSTASFESFSEEDIYTHFPLLVIK
jgi:hypothetical protein